MAGPGGLRQDRAIDDTTTTPLTVTHHSAVTEDQIDHLGHMNVRFYGVNAHAGTAAILDRLAMHAIRIDIIGPSYRQHVAKTRAAERTPAP